VAEHTSPNRPARRGFGLTRDLQGRLVACEGAGRGVIREEPDGTTTVIASSFQGRRLNLPNDVVVKSDGAIYFSDPNTNMVPDQTDLTYAGVYRVSPVPIGRAQEPSAGKPSRYRLNAGRHAPTRE
jgi:gluconolactonase